jgi:glycosyltransferase involved in cell wall biosynthesis
LSKKRLKEGNEIEQHAIQKANSIIYSSSWGAESAIKHYKANKNKISIIDFGANLYREPPKAELPVSFSEDEVCQLLFIGIDWDRKGGETALKILNELRKAGFKCKLTIVGCAPKLKEHSDNVVIVPFLDKNKNEEYNKLHEIYLKSHLLLLPTKADCTPIVFCEAAAFGIPVITSNTGGISSLIHEGVNGFLLPVNSNEIDYANKIISIFKDEKSYNSFRMSSRNEFESRLSWDIWIKKVNEVLDKSINN